MIPHDFQGILDNIDRKTSCSDLAPSFVWHCVTFVFGKCSDKDALSCHPMNFHISHCVYLCINRIFFSWAEVNLFNWSYAARRVTSPTILFFFCVCHASTPRFRRRMTCRLGSAVASTWTSPTIACIPWALMRPCSAWISEGASWTVWYPGAWQIVGLTPQQQVISELRTVIWHGMAWHRPWWHLFLSVVQRQSSRWAEWRQWQFVRVWEDDDVIISQFEFNALGRECYFLWMPCSRKR